VTVAPVNPPDGGVPLRRPATDAEARALASALRLRILRVCLDEEHTNKEIATVLRLDPATTLHHVRTLVRTGFLAAQTERRGARGAREIPYLATRKSWRMDVPAQDRVMLETFLEELAQVPGTDVQMARLGLRLPPDKWDEFQSRLFGLFEEFAYGPSDPEAQAWSLFVALHPDPNRPS
jgi:DNA-binding transcriptional ArsR family regulator